MTNRKNLGILALVLVVLVALSYMTSQRRYAVTEGGGYAPVLGKLEIEQVSTIRAWLGDNADEAVELQRSADGWLVASSWGWPAKESQIDRLLEDLGGLDGEIRSSSEDVLADYEIGDEVGLHVTGGADGGTELFHMVVGKSAARGGEFVRRHGTADVYVAQAGLRSAFGIWGDEAKPPESKRWVELRVHQVERNDVNRIAVRAEGKETVLEKVFAEPAEEGAAVDRAQWTWKPDGAGEFDKAKADGILSALSNVYASAVVEPGDLERYGLGDGARLAELTLEDGTVLPLYFGNAKEGDEPFLYFRAGNDGDPVEINKSTADRVFVARSELMPTEG